MWGCLVLLTLVACSQGAPTPSTSPVITFVKNLFQEIDTNNDGLYSKAEGLANILSADQNGDRKVSQEEFKSRWGSAAKSLGVDAGVVFVMEDNDLDGFLDESDLNHNYAMMDVDGNGKVDENEFAYHIVVILGSSGLKPTEFQHAVADVSLAMNDLNKDGYITVPESWSKSKAFDINGDGKISQLEQFRFLASRGNTKFSESVTKGFGTADYDGNGYWELADTRKYFEILDTDRDGRISKTEMLLGFAKSQQIQNGIAAAKKSSSRKIDFGFNDADANHDGNVTLDEEWANILSVDNNTDSKISLPEFLTTFAYYPADVVNTAKIVFYKYDNNSNGYLEKSDIAQFFNVIDTDGNGRVDIYAYVGFIELMFYNLGAVDLEAASEALTAPIQISDSSFYLSDTNNDKLLSLDEQWASVLRLDSNGDKKISKDEYVIAYVNFPPNIKVLAPQIFDQFDVDNNGYMERSDMEKAYKLLDTSGDGFVSFTEYAAFARKLFAGYGMDVTVSFNSTSLDFGFREADTNHDGLLSVDEQWASALQIDENGDNKISRDEYVTTFAPNDQPAGKKLFDRFDADKNGFLEKADVAKAFNVIDPSGDGLLTEWQYVPYVSQLYASMGVNITVGTTPTTTLDFGFREADTNHDGLLSVDEQWASALQIDKNGDNKISRDEYVTSFAPSDQPAGKKLFDRFDADKNGFLEKSDVAKAFNVIDPSEDGLLTEGQFVPYVSQLYASMGVNIPGATTPTPVDMSDFGFSAIDTNKDGQVTFEEEWAAVVVLDTNGDNRVSQVEYLKTFPPSMAAVGPKIFTKFDSDKNGFFEKVDIRRFLALVDTAGDGTISSSEYTSFVGTLLTSLGVDINNLTGGPTTPAS